MATSWRKRVIPFGAALVALLVLAAAIAASLQRRPAPPAVVAEYAPRSMSAPGADIAPPALVSAPPEAQGDKANASAPIAVSVPKLAYVYRLGFRLPGGRLAEVQDAHRALCESMGPARCQLMAMSRSVEGSDQAPARLNLRVATVEARAFSDRLGRIVSGSGGKAMATSVSAEDVSKAMVDAEARIRQREMLVARLTEILRTRRGTVSELVEAERSVATAQEELDQTRGWLAELRSRVAMSDFEIGYSQAETPKAEEIPAPQSLSLLDALSGSIGGLAMTLRVILLVLIFLAPWLLAGIPVALLVRRLAHRKRDGETVATATDA